MGVSSGLAGVGLGRSGVFNPQKAQLPVNVVCGTTLEQLIRFSSIIDTAQTNESVGKRIGVAYHGDI